MKLYTLVQSIQRNSFMAFAATTAMALAFCMGAVRPASAQAVVATAVAGTTPTSIAADPVTNLVFVANRGGNSVSVLNGATSVVVATVSVGTSPSAIAVNPATGKVYVANSGSNSLSVFSENTLLGASPTAPTPTSVVVGMTPMAIAVDASNNNVVVVNTGSGTVTTLNASGSVIGTAIVGTSPQAVAINPVTHTAYVTNSGSGNVSIIDDVHGSATNTVTVGTTPMGVAVNPVTGTVYVANSGSSSVSIIQGSSVIQALSTGYPAEYIGVNPVTDRIYVLYGGNGVDVIDGTSNAFVSQNAKYIGQQESAIAVDSVTNEIYVLSAWTGREAIYVIDGSTFATIAYPAVGTAPTALALNPVTNHVYVANSAGNSVSIVAGSTNTPSAPVSVPPSGARVVVNPITGIVYSASGFDPAANAGDITAFNPDGSKIPCNGSSQTICTLAYTPGTRGPLALTVDVTTNQIIAANGDGSITVVNGTTNSFSSNTPAPTGVATPENGADIAVNPVTNAIYVLNQDSAYNVTVTAFANGTTTLIPIQNGDYGLVSILVDPSANLIYVANNDGGGSSPGLYVIDGATNTVKTSYSFLSTGRMALNRETGAVFVAGDSQVTEVLPNGTQKAISPNLGGSPIFAIAADSVSNMVYVAAVDGSVAAIDANDPLLQTSTVIAGTPSTGCTDLNSACHASPSGMNVDDATGQVYVANYATNNVTVIDGESNGVIGEVVTSAGYSPNSVVVNPVTHQASILGQNSGGSNSQPSVVNTITPANVASIPLLTTITPPVSDPETIAITPIFLTTNTSPSFSVSATASYSTGTPSAATAIYYQLDTWQGAWTKISGASGTAALSNVSLGTHILFAYAAYGDEGTPDSIAGGAAGAPEIGNITALLFNVESQATTTTLTTDATPNGGSYTEPLNAAVTFTASVASTSSGNSVSSGQVSFYDGTTLLGTATLASGGTYQTSGLALGSHTITAQYQPVGTPGDAASTSNAITLNIVTQTTPTMVLTLSPASSITYGTVASMQVALTGSSGTPTGSISYTVDTGSVQTAPLSSGTATLNLGTPSAGSHTIYVTYSGDTNYLAITTAQTISLLVNNKTTPVITWANPAPISYGTALTAAQMDATASVSGTFAYNPAVGSTPAAGTQTLSVTFTPTDTTTYATATQTVTLLVNKAILSVTANDATRPYGAANPVLTGSVNGVLSQDTNNITVTYSTTATPSSAPGNYPITASVLGSAAGNYALTMHQGTLTIAEASQTITFPAIGNVVYGAAPFAVIPTATSGLLPGISVLSGPATISGNTVSIQGAGTVTLQATQSGNTVYGAAQPVTETFAVSPAILTITALNASRSFGAANPTFMYSTSGFVNRDTQVSAMTGIPSLTTTATATSGVGNYQILASIGTLAARNYTFQFVNGVLSIFAQAPIGPTASLTLGLNPSALTISQGATGATALTLTPAQGYSGNVTLSCADLPENVTCTFAHTSLQFSGNDQAQEVAITLATNADTQLANRQSAGSMAPAMALWWPTGIAGLLFAGKKRQRNKKSNILGRMLTVVLLTAAGLGIMGCAGGGPSLFTTPAGTQTVLIQATNAQGVQQSIPLQLTVTLK